MNTIKKQRPFYGLYIMIIGFAMACSSTTTSDSYYHGRWIEGEGDTISLKLIDKAFESLDVSSEMANLAMFYKRDWDGFVLSNTAWPAWWIQNTYGASYGMMPFLEEPYATWLKNAQGLWFRQMADGIRPDNNGYIAPDGSLCDATAIYRNGGSDLGFADMRNPDTTQLVNDGMIKTEATWYRQGDAGHESNDWGIGFTAAGLLMESERLLVRRDHEAIIKQLPRLKRVASFLDNRRDPNKNLLKGGKGSNLLAPGFNGSVDAEGKKQHGYLAELSVNYCAALLRLAEVCDLIGEEMEAKEYRTTAENIRRALITMMDDQGSFIMFKDTDGTKHGVYGAEKYGYFEATPNHDAVCMRVVDDETSKKIIKRMVSIKEMAPYNLILTNFPAYDEPNYPTDGLMTYGKWVHGGHWSTCQGRMNIACLRANEFNHPFKSWERMYRIMQNFRADAPFGDFGLSPWKGQMSKPHNTVYDCWGVPAGLVRGLFEYDYRHNGLRIRPHLPTGITSYIQKKAVVFGDIKIYLKVTGYGKATSATANNKPCKISKDGFIELESLGKDKALSVEIVCGNAKAKGAWNPVKREPLVFPNDHTVWHVPDKLKNKYHVDLKKLKNFYEEMVKADLEETYECAMARTSLELIIARYERNKMRAAGTLLEPDITPLPKCNQKEVEDFYLIMARNIAGGLTDHLSGLTIWQDVIPNARAIEVARQVGLFPMMRTNEDLINNNTKI